MLKSYIFDFKFNREITLGQRGRSLYRFSKSAMEALQEAAEATIVSEFESKF
jgi:histone H3/H4